MTFAIYYVRRQRVDIDVQSLRGTELVRWAIMPATSIRSARALVPRGYHRLRALTKGCIPQQGALIEAWFPAGEAPAL